MELGLKSAEWTVIDTRENSTMVDNWQEYLGIRQAGASVEVAILMAVPVDEVPRDWFDDEGELLPEHLDSDGDILLPETWDSIKLTGWDGEYFLGELEAFDDSAEINDLSEASLKIALDTIGWDSSDVAGIARNYVIAASGTPSDS